MVYGARLAQETGASFCLLHVYEMPVGMAPAGMGDMPVFMISDEELKKNSDQGLLRAKELVQASVPGITIETESRLGDVVEEINLFCKEKDAFATVIGTKHFSGVDKLLFGNTASSIIRHCTHPVISVPAETHAGSPKNIVLATDLTNVNEVPVAKIIEVIQSLKATLHIVHISEKSEAVKDPNATEQLLNMLKEVEPVFHTVADENVIHGLQTYVEQNNIDLLLALPHKHNLYERLFFKLHADGLIGKMSVPVMCVQ